MSLVAPLEAALRYEYEQTAALEFISINLAFFIRAKTKTLVHQAAEEQAPERDKSLWMVQVKHVVCSLASDVCWLACHVFQLRDGS